MRRRALITLLVGATALICASVISAQADAAEIRVLATKSTRLLIEIIRPLFEQTGNRIALTTDLPVATKRKIEAGEAFDVAILSPPLVSQLIKEGKIVEGTQANIVRVGIGVGVREGAPVPDKNAMLAASSIAYLKEGNTGLYLAKLFEKLGIADQLKPKTTLPMLDIVSDLVAKGEVEVGLTAISLLLAEPGVHTVGPIPSENQFFITFTGGVGAHAQQPDAARQLMKLLTAPEIVPLIRSKGMEPG
jgi:molybdate transport system substrate-binding protein